MCSNAPRVLSRPTSESVMAIRGERYRSGRNGVDSKSTCPVNSRARGFESHPLRQRTCKGIAGEISKKLFSCGEMSELAEGARLEIVCTPKRCTEGSNPSLSATPNPVPLSFPTGRSFTHLNL